MEFQFDHPSGEPLGYQNSFMPFAVSTRCGRGHSAVFVSNPTDEQYRVLNQLPDRLAHVHKKLRPPGSVRHGRRQRVKADVVI